MSFDNSRFTFDPAKNYSGVIMQQGRVQLDSDWNEWVAEYTRRTQAGTLDILGHAVVPATTPHAFQITASVSNAENTVSIGPGRMYVDGLLAENHGDESSRQWDPALAEMSASPQPPQANITGSIDYTLQPYYPNPPALTTNGPYLAYLDVWTRSVTYLEDSKLIDDAVGVDSTGRLQTVWQVKLLDLSNAGNGVTCNSSISGWPPPPSAGRLSTDTVPTAPSGPCCLTSGAAYTGMENQFYRVSIHRPGIAEAGAVPPTKLDNGIATFKWSRDNASVATSVSNIANVTNSSGNSASQLTVQSLGRDQVLGFAPGDWIEVLDDNLEFSAQTGELLQIDTIDFSARTITLAGTLGKFNTGDTDPLIHTRIRRWDQSGKVYKEDGTTVWWDLSNANGNEGIPVPPSGTRLILENGITVAFDSDPAGGEFLAGDFWTFAARTASGDIEHLNRVPPRGIHHHYAKLAIVNFNPPGAPDCRVKWPPDSTTSSCGCCTCTVGDGVESVGQYTSINDAIKALPVTGGEVVILPGRYYENVFIETKKDIVIRGCGWRSRIASATLNPDKIAAREAAAGNATGPFAAVITVSDSEHVQLLSLAVEAAQEEVGILLDGNGKLGVKPQQTGVNTPRMEFIVSRQGVIDTRIDDLVITASTRPAILANRVLNLQIENNRIAMENIHSIWPAMWVCGTEMRVTRNWVGVRNAKLDLEWIPSIVLDDLNSDNTLSATENTSGISIKKPSEGINTLAVGNASGTSIKNFFEDARRFATIFISKPLHPGGIQVAGMSKDVIISENEIEGAYRNGITLGSLTLLDAKGNETWRIVGVLVKEEDICETSGTLQVSSISSVSNGERLVAAGRLIDIQIIENRIRNTGLCGVGPVAFFDLSTELEIITIEDLTICENEITNTVFRKIKSTDSRSPVMGYGAICVPDVKNLIVHENRVTNFGEQPGDHVDGIFVFHGQSVEISNNHVLETRDWGDVKNEVSEESGVYGGIVVLAATPPELSDITANSLRIRFGSLATANTPPLFEPGLPALRVEHNVARVPLGEALFAMGLGPFSILANQLSSGGMITQRNFNLWGVVGVVNLGNPLELETATYSFSGFGDHLYTSGNAEIKGGFASSSNGTIVFSDNICQLESAVSKERVFSSVSILTRDSLIFSNNLCRLDGPGMLNSNAAVPTVTAILDAFLIAGSNQVNNNRFQEGENIPVYASGLTVGGLNITSNNISTYCLFSSGIIQPAISSNNITLAGIENCDVIAKRSNLKFIH